MNCNLIEDIRYRYIETHASETVICMLPKLSSMKKTHDQSEKDCIQNCILSICKSHYLIRDFGKSCEPETHST